MALTFIAITIWWLSADDGVPMWDASLHSLIAFDNYQALVNGDDPLRFFTVWSQYPPLVHFIGMLTALVVGQTIWAPVMAQNLIFMPLLVLACYQTGKLLYGKPLAGALAAAFALGTPMIMAQFHVFMVDAPTTAMTAVAVWLVLASRHFASVKVSAAAGAAVGFGMLTKQPVPEFVAGLVAAMLVRGGWRNWRGLLAFSGVALVVAAPWYLAHLDDITRLVTQVSGATTQPDSPVTPARLSVDNLGWYFWIGINYQTMVPLSVFALVGVAVPVWRLVNKRPVPPLMPEFLVGFAVTAVAVHYTLPHDPRYSLPWLVYLAVLGTGWIVGLPRRYRLIAQAALAIVVVANTLGASFGLGERVTLTLFSVEGKAPLHRGEFTFYSNDGYIWGGPSEGHGVRQLMARLHARGIRHVERRDGYDGADFTQAGFALVARSAGLTVDKAVRRESWRAPPGKVFVVSAPLRSNEQPCVVLPTDTVGIWITRDRPFDADSRLPRCPRALQIDL